MNSVLNVKDRLTQRTASCQNPDKTTLKKVVFTQDVQTFPSVCFAETTGLESIQQCLHRQLFLKGTYFIKKKLRAKLPKITNN